MPGSALLISTAVDIGKFSATVLSLPFCTVNLPASSLTYVLTLFIYNNTLKVRETGGLSLAGLFFLPTDQSRSSPEEVEGLSTQHWAAETGIGFQSNSQLHSVRQQYYKLIVSPTLDKDQRPKATTKVTTKKNRTCLTHASSLSKQL